MARIRPLDGNTKRAVFSRGKPTYPMGSPNALGVNQHKGVKVPTNPIKPEPTKPVQQSRPMPTPNPSRVIPPPTKLARVISGPERIPKLPARSATLSPIAQAAAKRLKRS